MHAEPRRQDRHRREERPGQRLSVLRPHDHRPEHERRHAGGAAAARRCRHAADLRPHRGARALPCLQQRDPPHAGRHPRLHRRRLHRPTGLDRDDRGCLRGRAGRRPPLRPGRARGRVVRGRAADAGHSDHDTATPQPPRRVPCLRDGRQLRRPPTALREGGRVRRDPRRRCAALVVTGLRHDLSHLRRRRGHVAAPGGRDPPRRPAGGGGLAGAVHGLRQGRRCLLHEARALPRPLYHMVVRPAGDPHRARPPLQEGPPATDRHQLPARRYRGARASLKFGVDRNTRLYVAK